MNNKTLSNYLVGTVAVLGLAVGSVAFAQTLYHGTTMWQTTLNGMHGQVAQDGMHGQAVQKNFNDSMHGNANATQHAQTGHYNGNTHCNSAANNQDRKS